MSKSRDNNLPDLDYIRELAKVFKHYELDEIEIETGEQRVLLRRGDAAVVAPVVAAPQPVAIPTPAAAPAPERVTAAPVPVVAAEPEGDFITSPFVGTFYNAPRPDTPPFVVEGQKVEAGTTVCLVEAMKLFNEIEVDFPCVIEQCLVGNAEAVEFGTKLFRVRKP